MRKLVPLSCDGCNGNCEFSSYFFFVSVWLCVLICTWTNRFGKNWNVSVLNGKWWGGGAHNNKKLLETRKWKWTAKYWQCLVAFEWYVLDVFMSTCTGYMHFRSKQYFGVCRRLSVCNVLARPHQHFISKLMFLCWCIVFTMRKLLARSRSAHSLLTIYTECFTFIWFHKWNGLKMYTRFTWQWSNWMLIRNWVTILRAPIFIGAFHLQLFILSGHYVYKIK